VAHVGQELALGAVGFFGIFPRLFCLLNQPGVANGHGGAIGQVLKKLNLSVGKVMRFEEQDV